MAFEISKLNMFGGSLPLSTDKEQTVTGGRFERKVACTLTLVTLCLCAASLAGQFSKYYLGHDQLMGLVQMFDLNAEANFPNWYSSSILLIASFLLLLVAYSKKKEADRYVLHWTFLSLIFLFLSADEAAGIHDLLSDQMHAAIHTKGIIFYGWVIPYAILTLIFAVSYLRFVFSLPAKTRNLFIIAGIIYVGGALGMELPEGRWVDLYGENNMTMAFMTTIEEFGEMMGVTVFIYALLWYISSHTKLIVMQIARDEVEPLER